MEERGVDGSWRYSIHGHTPATDLPGKRPAEIFEWRFRTCIDPIEASRRTQERRAHIDNTAIVRDATRCLLHDEERSLCINTKGAIKIFFSHLHEWLFDDQTSIVDHDIDAPKGVECLVE